MPSPTCRSNSASRMTRAPVFHAPAGATRQQREPESFAGSMQPPGWASEGRGRALELLCSSRLLQDWLPPSRQARTPALGPSLSHRARGSCLSDPFDAGKSASLARRPVASERETCAPCWARALAEVAPPSCLIPEPWPAPTVVRGKPATPSDNRAAGPTSPDRPPV
jgi:hypothetical protein